MKTTMLTLLCSVVGAFAAETKPLVATAVNTENDPTATILYDAKMLTAELAAFAEVERKEFYYLDVFPLPAAKGTATLAGGETVAWFHYERGGLYLKFADGKQRYFLHPAVMGEKKPSSWDSVYVPKQDANGQVRY